MKKLPLPIKKGVLPRVLLLGEAMQLCPHEGLPHKGLNGLKPGRSYSFTRIGLRKYPIEKPISLFNRDGEEVATVAIPYLEWRNGRTRGKYVVLEVYGNGF